MKGKSKLETLSLDDLSDAQECYAGALTSASTYAPAHAGMANACALRYESTRIDPVPDLASLQLADHHARTACELDDGFGEAWAARGFIAHRLGHADDANAFCRKATSLEPGNWRHWGRLAEVSWGEDRLVAARHAEQLCPRLPLASL